jgi:general secretion pathway protein A
MYLEYYGFSEAPFSLSPNPRFIFFSKTHKEAFALLLYGINKRFGFIELLGEVGTGKTTILRTLLSQLDEQKYRTALIFNPALTTIDLMRAINHEFGVSCESENIAELLDNLNRFLLLENSAGRTVVLVIDEAQNLAPHLLEQIRLISNLETDTDKLIQIVLAGQPELGRLLEKPALRQINQRIALRYNLLPLDMEDSRAYIAHRLAMAGGEGRVSIPSGALGWLYLYSRGTPRLINILCDRALLIAYTEDRRKITSRTVALAFRDVMLKPAFSFLPITRKGAAVALMAALLVTGTYFFAKHGKAPSLVKPAVQTKVNPAASAMLKPLPKAAPAKSAVAPETPRPVIATATTKPAVAHETAKTPVAPRVSLAALKTAKPAAAPAANAAAVSPIVQNAAKKGAVPSPLPAAGQPDSTGVKRLQNEDISLQNEAKNAVQAFNALASFWQVPPIGHLNERSPILAQLKGRAGKSDLDLINFNGRVDELLRLNSPALLNLSQKGKKGNLLVALTGVRNGKLVIHPSLMGRNTFSKAEITRFWSGQAFIPWRNREKIHLPMAQGAAGSDVIRVQILLQAAGFRSLEVNGLYDEATVKTVKDFQSSRKISDTGKVGPITLIQLYKAVNGASLPSLGREGKKGGV